MGTKGLCAVFRDLAPWKKAADELTAAKRQAERTSSAKTDFLAKISHEIRTPLNAIIRFSEIMAQESSAPSGNERYRQYLVDIQSSGEHLLSLVNDLLDLLKIEAGKLELDFTRLALNPLTQQCTRDHAAASQSRAHHHSHLAVAQAAAGDRRRAVSPADSWLNLISNSTKFTAPAGR